MSKVLKDLLYAKSHEWVKVEGNVATIGITDHAQDSLGSIVYLETNDLGDVLSQFGQFGTIESVKAASDLFVPISGKIIAINNDVIDNPEMINDDAYENWIIKVELSDASELNNLLSADAYKEMN